jgi:putative oxidoreductase
MTNRLSAYAPQALSVLRIIAALLFLAHGTQKLMGFPAAEFAPPMFSIFWFAGVIEIITGILIGIGLFTRPAAFIASGTMAFAYFMVHAPGNFFPANNGGDAAILFCFVFLFLVFAGPGVWSVEKR